MGSAIFSDCGLFRYRLDRDVQSSGLVLAFFGVNGATAGAHQEDQTTRKWFGFTLQNNGRKYIAGNPYAYCATDVRKLAKVDDPIGPLNDYYLGQIVAEADILVPCWGSRQKVPERLRDRFDWLRDRIFSSGKPVRVFGFTASGDPKHPLMLGYDTPLIDWESP